MISVIMSIYNESLKWIIEAVDSILNQTYKEFELIVVIDNPSIDFKIKNYLKEKQLHDSRILLLFNEKNLGLAESLNRALNVASGKYIARMDSDDISMLDRLEKELIFLEATNSDLVATNKILIDEDSGFIKRDPPIKRRPKESLIYGNFINHSSVLMKNDVVKNCGGYRQMPNSEDYDLWLRMLDRGYKLIILDEYLLKYRIRCNSASIERQLEQYYISQYILKCHKERVKSGKDSYSTENLLTYMNSKDFSSKSKINFSKAVSCLEHAIVFIEGKNYFSAIRIIIYGLFYNPKYVISRIVAQLRIHRSNTRRD